jgi:hypothetical protein
VHASRTEINARVFVCRQETGFLSHNDAEVKPRVKWGMFREIVVWPAPGSEDTELGVLMELEVGHGETEVYARVQA